MSQSGSNKPYTSQSGSTVPMPTYYTQDVEGRNLHRGSNAQGASNTNNDAESGSTSTLQTQTIHGTDPKHGAMIDKRIQLGNDSYTIKGYFFCGNKHMFALECDKIMSGYDGICPECKGKHMSLGVSRGYYTPVENIYEIENRKKMEKERSEGPKGIEDLTKISDSMPPLNRPILGKNKGIEGDSNSCYMDSTIFCMYAYTDIFDSLLNVEIENRKKQNLQRLLRENIVNVLRSSAGFVERDTMYHLRALLSETTGDRSFKQMEKDPSEFLRALEKLFNFAPLKTVAPDQRPKEDQSNITTNIIWEMFDPNPTNMLQTNIATVFRNSLQEIPAKLATIPPFLILVAPRHTRTQRSYRYIVPDSQITLDNKVLQLACSGCQKVNHGPDQPREFYSCAQCFSNDPVMKQSRLKDAQIFCYCGGCLASYHSSLSEQERLTHRPKQMKSVIHKLNLFAVLCIETSHYVAFVKCHKQNQDDEWLFFDSMSDRVNNDKNISCVSSVPNFERWISDVESVPYFFQDLDDRRSQGKPTSQAFSEDEMRRLRLFRDGAFFFYENPNGTYQ